LKGQQYDTLLSILYIGYILMQVPSNMLLNHMGRPSIYLPCCVTLWSLISCLTGATTKYVYTPLRSVLSPTHRSVCQLCRRADDAVLPRCGALFLLSKWYTRSALGLRTAVLSCGLLISNAFGSLVASGILDGVQGKLGHAAWRWLFYIEGALTIFVAARAIVILPDFPSTAHRWLSPPEVRLAEKRTLGDVGTADGAQSEGGQLAGLRMALADGKVWRLALALASMVISLSFNVLFPTLGYSETVTLLLCWVRDGGCVCGPRCLRSSCELISLVLRVVLAHHPTVAGRPNAVRASAAWARGGDRRTAGVGRLRAGAGIG